jgi:hypothetical protein
MDFNGLGLSLFTSCSVEIGGGTGYWCAKCNKLYQTKPDICHNIIIQNILNTRRLIELMQQVYSINLREEDINNRDHVPVEIRQILEEENECLTIEESFTGKYDTFIDMVSHRYPEVYDKIKMECGCDTFIHEQRKGDEIDGHDVELLDKIKPKETVYVPLPFAFYRY